MDSDHSEDWGDDSLNLPVIQPQPPQVEEEAEVLLCNNLSCLNPIVTDVVAMANIGDKDKEEEMEVMDQDQRQVLSPAPSLSMSTPEQGLGGTVGFGENISPFIDNQEKVDKVKVNPRSSFEKSLLADLEDGELLDHFDLLEDEDDKDNDNDNGHPKEEKKGQSGSVICSDDCHQFIDERPDTSNKFVDMHGVMNAKLGRHGSLDFMENVKKKTGGIQVHIPIGAGGRVVKMIGSQPQTKKKFKSGEEEPMEEKNVNLEEDMEIEEDKNKKEKDDKEEVKMEQEPTPSPSATPTLVVVAPIPKPRKSRCHSPIKAPSPSPETSPSRQNSHYYKKDMQIIDLFNGRPVCILYMFSYNHVLVIPADIDRDLLDLKDAIVDQIENLDSTLMNFPKVGELVLGKIGSGKKDLYNRAVVKDVFPQWGAVRVYFIDTGDTAKLALKNLKSVNQEIFDFPIYGREVFLDGISADENLILWSEYEEYMKPMLRRRIHKIELVGEDSKVCPPSVRLFREQNGQNVTVNDEIKKLEKWEWMKKFEDGAVCDDDMIALKRENNELEIFQYDLSVPKLKLGSEIEMKVLLYGDSESFITFPSDNRFHFNKDLKVLECQIQKYCDLIKPNSFIPKDNQVFLFHNGEKWIRAARFATDAVLGIDDGSRFQYEPLISHMRPLPLDFAKVNCLGVHCVLQGISKRWDWSTQKIAAEILKPGTVHNFKIRDVDKNIGIYTLECPEVTMALKENALDLNDS